MEKNIQKYTKIKNKENCQNFKLKMNKLEAKFLYPLKIKLKATKIKENS